MRFLPVAHTGGSAPGLRPLPLYVLTCAVPPARKLLYGRRMKVEEHWWNGDTTPRGRRDVYIRTDGQGWEVRAQIGGASGRERVQQCPSRASATILADAWRGTHPSWRELKQR
jgi:hypothetical protein